MSHARWTWAASTAALVLAATRGARGSGADGLMVGGITGIASFDGYEISPGIGEDEPKPFAGKNLRLDGTGAFVGGGLRATSQSFEGVRGGIGLGVFGASGLDLRYRELAPGLRAEGSGLFGFDVEAFLGKGFLAPPIYPYIDLRLAFDIFGLGIALKSDADGLLSSTPYTVLSLNLGPRLGVFVPVDHTFFFDLSGSYSVFGAERAMFFAGIGIWDGTIDRDKPSDQPRFPEERDGE